MGRFRRRDKGPAWIQLIPPLGALFALGWIFSPNFRTIVGAFLIPAIVAAVGLLVWRKMRSAEWDQYNPPAKPEVDGGDETGADVEHRRNWTRELLGELEWKRFEDVIAAYIRELGHDARVTRIGPDGGVDIEVVDRATGKVGSVIQCKAWDAYKVGVKPMRELLGVMAAAKVTEGGFFTTGEFTTEARVFALANGIDPVDGSEFLARVHQLPGEAVDRLLDVATEGDYQTPTCPSCGIKMVLRTAGKGRNEGSQFWGCTRYPRCRNTLKFSAPRMAT